LDRQRVHDRIALALSRRKRISGGVKGYSIDLAYGAGDTYE
jgi:hypothetical protein